MAYTEISFPTVLEAGKTMVLANLVLGEGPSSWLGKALAVSSRGLSSVSALGRTEKEIQHVHFGAHNVQPAVVLPG